MSKLDDLPVNFTLARDAVVEIERMRAALNAESTASALVVGIGWGFFKPKGYADFAGPVVGFYGQKKLASLRGGIERVSGLDIFFFILREHYANFEGRVLDFSPERMFFLRAPLPENGENVP